MPTIQLTGPDGKTYELTPPKGASPEEIAAGIEQFKAAHTPVVNPIAQPQQTGLLGSLAREILPVSGAIAGGTLGAASPLPGGAALGTTVGAGAGEAIQQGLEMMTGRRTAFAPSEIGTTAAEQGAMELVGGPLLRVAGRVLKPAATRAVEAVLPMANKAEARMVQAYRAARPFWGRVMDIASGAGTRSPRTVAQSVVEQGLYGGETALGIQAKRASGRIWKDMLEPALKASPVKINLPQFFDELRQEIIQKTPELGRRQDLLDALDALRKPYANKLFTVKDIPIATLQKLKEGWAQFVPQKAYQGKPIEGMFKNVSNRAAALARRKIYNALGDESKQAYLDYGNLQRVMEHGQRVMTGGRRQGGFGAFWSSLKDMAVTPVATIGAQTVYRTADGLELVGAPKGRVVRDILPGLADAVRSSNQPTLPNATPGPHTLLDQLATGEQNPELLKSAVALAGTTEKGRAAIRLAYQIDPQGGATFQHILAMNLRSQLPVAQPLPTPPDYPKPLPTPPAVR